MELFLVGKRERSEMVNLVGNRQRSREQTMKITFFWKKIQETTWRTREQTSLLLTIRNLTKKFERAVHRVNPKVLIPFDAFVPKKTIRKQKIFNVFESWNHISFWCTL